MDELIPLDPKNSRFQSGAGITTYELAFLVKEEAESSIVTAALERCGATIINANPLSRIRLAYPIRHETQAFFGHVVFSLDPARISEVDEILRLDHSLLRYLTITPPIEMRSATPREEGYPAAMAPKEKAKPVVKPASGGMLSNEALEEKLEEILK